MAAKKAASKKKAVASSAPARKTTAKKAAAKKTAAKVASRPAAKVATRGVGSSDKPPTKTEIIASIAESTELSRKEVSSVFEALNGLIQQNLKPRGPGMFSVPGLMKIRVVKKPRTPQRKGINPFTGEETVFKAKPARKVVKVVPLKNLKDMV